MKDYQQAEECCLNCLKIDENSTAANAVYALLWYRKGKYEEAIKYNKIAVESDDVDMHTYFNYVYFNYLNGNHERAEEILQEAIKLVETDKDKHSMIKGIERIIYIDPRSLEFCEKYIKMIIDKFK